MNPTPASQHRHTDSGALRVVIAGGGTGGHLFPGIAMAQAFQARSLDSRVLFVGTGNRFETQALADLPFSHTAIAAEGIKGRGMFQKLRALVKIPLGIFSSIRLLRRFRADLVVGVGGYVSAPVVMAAFLLRIPIVLQEQNLLPGMANRVLGRLASRIYVSFANTRSGFAAKKIRVTGNPVRAQMVPSAARARNENTDTQFTVLICGGSQGAHAINDSVVAALPHLRKLAGLVLIHQTGNADEATVRDAYRAHGISGRVGAFFTDMASAYTRADLVVCRAGATTVAELTAMGKPVIFIPYPFAADQHQVLNAKALVDAGAAEIIYEDALSGDLLAERVAHFGGHRDELTRMAARARALGRPGAARDIVDDCYRLLAGRGDSPTDQPVG